LFIKYLKALDAFSQMRILKACFQIQLNTPFSWLGVSNKKEINMSGKIENFSIIGLHGYKDYSIDMIDNTTILVGENGAGKTTVLRLFYYLLSGQIGQIAQYNFNELKIKIDGKYIVLTRAMLESYAPRINARFLRNLPPSLNRRIIEIYERNGGHMPLNEIRLMSDKFDLPLQYLLDEIDFSEADDSEDNYKIREFLKGIKESISCQILYLPTYRRIEEELNIILKGIDEDEWKRNRVTQKRIRDGSQVNTFVELVEFGMKDVENAVKNILDGLKDFARENLNTLTLGYLGDVVEQEYLKVDIAEINDATEETIKSVLDRIHENILSKKQKDQLFKSIDSVRSGDDPNEHVKVLCHYFLKLLHFQQDLTKKEAQLTNFCNVCNQYLVDKKIVYKSDTFKLDIEHSGKNKHQIELKCLSSGEKQIVSLFSHVYLSAEKKFFVLIDEPELSLSVPWQRKFLADIKNGAYCSGLFAVTHSPFVYENELIKYTHGLGEFLK